jgi:hypothetical protein
MQDEGRRPPTSIRRYLSPLENPRNPPPFSLSLALLCKHPTNPIFRSGVSPLLAAARGPSVMPRALPQSLGPPGGRNRGGGLNRPESAVSSRSTSPELAKLCSSPSTIGTSEQSISSTVSLRISGALYCIVWTLIAHQRRRPLCSAAVKLTGASSGDQIVAALAPSYSPCSSVPSTASRIS